MNRKNKLVRAGFALTASVIALFGSMSIALADKNEISMSLSPMKQSIVLSPGSTYHGSFKIVNPNSSSSSLDYEIEQKSFYVDDDYGTTFDEVDAPIVGWTTLNSDISGTLEPNSNIDVKFTINVPMDAVGGGQYEAFLVKTKGASAGDGSMTNGAGINEQLIMAHLVFAEITGDVIRQGEIVSADVPSFLLSGNIAASSAIKNTGNIHGKANYKMQVFPLFSNEEVYTNEEDPDEHIILPDRTFYNETVWNETPIIGIFNVLYTVEFEGVTTQVSKMVIKCPIWLLFIILFAITALIIWIIMRVKVNNKKKSRKAATTAE